VREIRMFETADTKRLREMIQQASDIQQSATQLVVDLTDQLQRSILLHNDTSDDRPARSERRRKPRS
jgi:hypothetical protein